MVTADRAIQISWWMKMRRNASVLFSLLCIVMCKWSISQHGSSFSYDSNILKRLHVWTKQGLWQVVTLGRSGLWKIQRFYFATTLIVLSIVMIVLLIFVFTRLLRCVSLYYSSSTMWACSGMWSHALGNSIKPWLLREPVFSSRRHRRWAKGAMDSTSVFFWPLLLPITLWENKLG